MTPGTSSLQGEDPFEILDGIEFYVGEKYVYRGNSHSTDAMYIGSRVEGFSEVL